MPANINISSAAQKELDDSIDYYDEQSFGLGEEFYNSIYQDLYSIAKNPEAYPKIDYSLRSFVANKFRFVIVYEYLPVHNLIVIAHIFHTSRNPKHKYRKSK